jgi:hypothetical protein
MSTYIERHVKQLFADVRRQTGKICENPVTGGRFIVGDDCIFEQERLAVNALKARDWSGVPDLPLTQHDRERKKGKGGIDYIKSLFARSLAHRDYRTDGHPTFDQYARGVMASDMIPKWLRDEWIQMDVELLRRYPPTPLKGMGGGLIWRGA